MLLPVSTGTNKDLSLKSKDLHCQTSLPPPGFKTFTLENGVIYSHIFITLQAAILPAKNFNEFKLFVDK